MNRDKGTRRDGRRRVVDFPTPESVDTQAAKWLAILDSDNPPQHKVEEFKVWVNQSESHREAFEELLSLWDEMNILTQSVPPRRKKGRNFVPRGFWPGCLAAGLSLVVLAVLMLALLGPGAQESIYVTEIGEQKTVRLPDGSSVLLNTNTWLKVDYDSELRRVQLERGEALFQIAKDSRRPFEVYAGDGIIRAVGTAFTVHLRNAAVEVLVTEGVVEIEKGRQKQPIPAAMPAAERTFAPPDFPALMPMSQPGPVPAQISAGTRAVFDLDEFDAVELAQLDMPRMDAQLAWRHGVLAFDQEPLEKVVEEMARYTSLKLVIPDRHCGR